MERGDQKRRFCRPDSRSHGNDRRRSCAFVHPAGGSGKPAGSSGTPPPPHARPWLLGLMMIGIVFAAAGCHTDMYDQPRFEDYEPAPFFEDSTSVRPLVPNTVSRETPRSAFPHFFYGVVEGQPAESFPFEITQLVMKRGQERYNVFCAPCHGYAGYGNGMIVQRGFDRKPPSFHAERLRNAPVGHYFDVITNGFGIMYEYGDRIDPIDRWAIIAYIRALQLSQHAELENMPDEVYQELGVEPPESEE